MYVLILQTSLLLSNTRISRSLEKLENAISNFAITWPVHLTFHTGRLYDFNRLEMARIWALSACLNREHEMYFVQKRDDIDLIFETKENSEYFNSSYGTSFYFLEKSRKVLGPRKQIIPV